VTNEDQEFKISFEDRMLLRKIERMNKQNNVTVYVLVTCTIVLCLALLYRALQ